jgi:hypothetical protein
MSTANVLRVSEPAAAVRTLLECDESSFQKRKVAAEEIGGVHPVSPK